MPKTLELVRGRLTAARKQIDEGMDLLNRMQQAGEDVLEDRMKLEEAEEKLRRYEIAFGTE